MASKSSAKTYTDPELRDRLKAEVTAGDKGGKPGQWSARKAQLLKKKYEDAGGKYVGKKTAAQKSLGKWSDEKWQTADGKPAARGGETARYLPQEGVGRTHPGREEGDRQQEAQGVEGGEADRGQHTQGEGRPQEGDEEVAAHPSGGGSSSACSSRNSARTDSLTLSAKLAGRASVRTISCTSAKSFRRPFAVPDASFNSTSFGSDITRTPPTSTATSDGSGKLTCFGWPSPGYSPVTRNSILTPRLRITQVLRPGERRHPAEALQVLVNLGERLLRDK